MAKSKEIVREEEETEEKSLHPSVFGESVEDLSEEDINELAASDDYDIFDDVGAKLVAAGDHVTYSIRHNGVYREGALPHPQSWDKVRYLVKTGGSTQATVRSNKRGGYVKSQTRYLAPIDDIPKEKEPISAGNASNSTELFMLMQQMKREEREESQRQLDRMESDRREREEKAQRDSERRESEAKEREEKRLEDERKKAAENMSSNQMMMTMMFKMMETQSTNSAAMITAMLTKQPEKKEELSLNKIMEMMDTRMEKTIALLTNAQKDKKGEPSISEQIKMLNDAEERGYKKARDIQQIAEDKAEELAEIRESGGTRPAAPEGPSTAKVLIESLAPAVQAFISSRMAPPAVAAPAAPAVSQLAGTTQLPPTAPARPMPVQARPIVAQRSVVGPIRTLNARPVASHEVTQGPARVGPQPGTNVMPAAPKSAVVAAVIQPQSQPQPAKDPTPTAPQSVASGNQLMNKKELIQTTVFEEIGKDVTKNLLTGAYNPEKTADLCLVKLNPFGIDANYLSSQFTLADMISIAKAQKIPDAIRPYLERFHARVAALASSATPSENPENPIK